MVAVSSWRRSLTLPRLPARHRPPWQLPVPLAPIPAADVARAGRTIGPDNLQVTVSRDQVKSAPNIDLRGDELSTADESTLYHHYRLNYSPPDTKRDRRLARR
jgi:hypothetical protein